MKQLMLWLCIFFLIFSARIQAAPFLMEKTQFTPISGDCAGGKGVLQITAFEDNAVVTGTYTGECQDNRPHGSGELVSPDPLYGFDRIVKGTWRNGAYHGKVVFIYPKALATQVSKEIYTYKDDQREGAAEIYDGKGRLMLVHEYRDDRIISSIYVDPEGQKTSIEFDPQYIANLIADADKKLPEYQRTLTRDEYYVQNLTDEQTVHELFQLQHAIDQSLANHIFIAEKGITLYEPVTTGRLNLFSLMHAARLNHLRLDLGRSMPRKYEYGYTAMYLGFTDMLGYTPPEKWPSLTTAVDTLKNIPVPSKVTDGLVVYLAPFTVPDTNGYYEFDHQTIALFGSGFFPTTAGPSAIAHELGHAVHDRIMRDEDWKQYWSLRSVPPRKSDYYGNVSEVFAEDFRVLFGNSEKASYMRKGQWLGRFGDIREFPDKKQPVLDFINQKMKEYSPKQSMIEQDKFLYHRIYRPSDSIRILANQDEPFQARIIKFQRIPMGVYEKYKTKTNTVSLQAMVHKGKSVWVFDTNKNFVWDKLEILEDGKVIRTALPGEEILMSIDDPTKKYEGRYITYLEPASDGPMENFVEEVEVYSKTIGQGEAVFSLKDYPTGFYQLEISNGSDDKNAWQYFFAVYSD